MLVSNLRLQNSFRPFDVHIKEFRAFAGNIHFSKKQWQNDVNHLRFKKKKKKSVKTVLPYFSSMEVKLNLTIVMGKGA